MRSLSSYIFECQCKSNCLPNMVWQKIFYWEWILFVHNEIQHFLSFIFTCNYIMPISIAVVPADLSPSATFPASSLFYERTFPSV